MNSTTNSTTGVDLDSTVVVALGGNLQGEYPSSEALLEAALARFASAGMTILRRSSWWRSAAWPDAGQPEYRNGIVLVETDLDPQATLRALHAIEARFGRHRGETNAPRTLDLDLIAHGRSVLRDGGVTIPHPRAHERRFVMGPLAEIAPAWRHPVLSRSAADLAASATVGTDATPVI